MRLPAWLLALALALAPVCALAQNPLLLGVGQVSASGCAYSSQACALFAVMTSSPDGTRKGLINTAITCMISNGSWAKEDWLVVMASGNSHDGLLNWVNPAKTLVIGGAMTFTTDRGFNTTTRSVNNFLNMPELLDAAGNNYSLNSAHTSAYFNAFDFQSFGGLTTSGGTAGSAEYNTSLGQYDSSKAFFSEINSNTAPPALTTGVDTTAANYIGMWATTRTASNAQALYKSGLPVNLANAWTDSTTSTTVPAKSTGPKLLWGDTSADYDSPSTTTRIAVWSTGTKFANSTEAGNESSCMTTYLTAIGAS